MEKTTVANLIVLQLHFSMQQIIATPKKVLYKIQSADVHAKGVVYHNSCYKIINHLKV